MALVPIPLQTALTAIFNAMNPMAEGGNAYMAAQTAAALKTYILTGQVSTVDAGATPAGSYAGAGIGTMTIDAEPLRRALQATFEAGYPNNDLAAHIASDIDVVCTMADTVSILSVGVVTTPVGASSPFSGPGQGTFSGSKAVIETLLKACFEAMNRMPSGGNEFFAAQLAAGVDAYLKAGTISVQLAVPPFVSGSGGGKIA